MHIVITVPAIWKGYARQAMREAAKKAGILNLRMAGATTLTFAPEPEAAALSTLLEQGSGVAPGNVYVICDAGVLSIVGARVLVHLRQAMDSETQVGTSYGLGSRWQDTTTIYFSQTYQSRDIDKHEHAAP